MPRPRPNVGIFAAILLVIVLLPAAYMGAYHAMLGLPQINEEWAAGAPLQPGYRITSPVVETMLWPAHQIDRKIRREYWGD